MALRRNWLSFLSRIVPTRRRIRHTRRRPSRGLWRHVTPCEQRILPSSTPVLVKDISPGTTPGSSSIHNVMEVGPQVFFSLNTLEGGTELYVSDGTAAGTALVRSFQVDTQIESMTAFDGALYFTASTGDHGQELWKSDGTAAGTVMLKDIFGGQESS